MAQYDVPTPSTLLLRVSDPTRSGAALRMMQAVLPAARAPAMTEVRVCTLSDVSSVETTQPLAVCLIRHEFDAPDAWLARFAVAVPFRRRGLGRRLLAEVTTTVRAEGAGRLWAALGDHQTAMSALVGSAGFVISPAASPTRFPAGFDNGEDGPQKWWVRDL